MPRSTKALSPRSRRPLPIHLVDAGSSHAARPSLPSNLVKGAVERPGARSIYVADSWSHVSFGLTRPPTSGKTWGADQIQCLINPPRAVARTQMGSDPFFQLRRIGLDPAKKGCVVDRDATVQEHQFKIAVADREHQIPTHGPEDHLGRELPALEVLAPRHDTCAAIRLVETARLPNSDPPHKLATDPWKRCGGRRPDRSLPARRRRRAAHHPGERRRDC